MENQGNHKSHRDPVCGMNVDPAKAAGQHEYKGTTYYFCNPRCLARFQAEPETYLAQGFRPVAMAGMGLVRLGGPRLPVIPAQAAVTRRSAPPAAKIRYICPMDPEVVSDRPGACPKCGMALEPEEVPLDEAPNPELVDMTRRFWISLAFSVPLVGYGMAEMLLGHERLAFLPMRVAALLQIALAAPVVLWAGWPLLQRAWRSLLRRSPNMFTLIGLGVGTAFGFSVVAALWPGLLPAAFHKPGAPVPLYFEPAAAITSLVLLGQVLELRARQATGGAIRSLLKLAPKHARLVGQDGAEQDIPIEQVQIGQRLRVRPCERVPVDGVVDEGTRSVDESMLTGESLPVDKSPSSPISGGTQNGAGSLIMRAQRVGAGTLLAQIVRRVAEAQRSRAPIQRVADRVSGWFVPAVVVVSLITFITWSFVGPEPRLAYALVNAVAVLIIACPCALGLATPMSVMVGMGRGAHAGVLVRDAATLETLARVDTLVLDKTGTLTEGKPELHSVLAEGMDADKLLSLTASLERASEHPLAAAIVRAAQAKGLALTTPQDFHYQPGRGVSGRIGTHTVAAGTQEFLEQMQVEVKALLARAEELRAQGHALIMVAVDGKGAGLLDLADSVKPHAAETLAQLRSEGLRLVMLTGDHRASAEAMASRLGITEVVAQVSPSDKADAIKRLQAEGRVVAMAGDGINDAPALAQAQVGIAMGSGTDVAIESAGITLVKGDLRAILRARRLSRATLTNIRQNLFFAFIYNSIGIPLAAGVLYPFTGLLLSPMIASAAMSLSSVSVIGNALRLRKAVL